MGQAHPSHDVVVPPPSSKNYIASAPVDIHNTYKNDISKQDIGSLSSFKGLKKSIAEKVLSGVVTAISSSASLLNRSFVSIKSLASGGSSSASLIKQSIPSLKAAQVFAKSNDVNLLPAVFSWSYGGASVYVAGSFNNWAAKIPLVHSTNDFSLILDMPPGKYEYRYIVDDEWQCAPDQDTAMDANGQVINVVDLTTQENRSFLKELIVPSTAIDLIPHLQYSQDLPACLVDYDFPNDTSDYFLKDPPCLPPHLGQSAFLPLNNMDDFNSEWPYVTLNHVFSSSSKQEPVSVLALTQRFKEKVVTTVLYAPNRNFRDFSENVDDSNTFSTLNDFPAIKETGKVQESTSEIPNILVSMEINENSDLLVQLCLEVLSPG